MRLNLPRNGSFFNPVQKGENKNFPKIGGDFAGGLVMASGDQVVYLCYDEPKNWIIRTYAAVFKQIAGVPVIWDRFAPDYARVVEQIISNKMRHRNKPVFV